MNKPFILYFNEIKKKDLSKVGGKGANLGEMTGAGFPVPYGFCVTTESFRQFIAENELLSYVRTQIETVSLGNAFEIGRNIRTKIIQADMPLVVRDSILYAIRLVGVEKYYAVRSSATAEDLSFASFAGQQDTYLNVKGEEALINSIKECWASLFTERAILYRIQHQIDHEQVDMSVVVQTMVFPETSGIMFTADPLSGHRKILSIDAGYGLGEALVSGLVSPDIYKIKKTTGRIEHKIISEKRLAIMPVLGGGTEKIEISSKQSKQQVLKDDEILELASLGMEIEQHYGCPQDIEWCMEEGRFHIVQSRPITSLFPLPKPLPENSMLHVYLSYNHIQVMTDPISPMGLDIILNIFKKNTRTRKGSERTFLKTSAGRIYVDITDVLHIKLFRKNGISYIRTMDTLMAEALSELISRDGIEDQLEKGNLRKGEVYKILLPLLIKTVCNLLFRKPRGTVQYFQDYMNKYIKKVEQNVCRDRKKGIGVIIQHGCLVDDFLKSILPKLIPGAISLKLLESMEKKLFGTSQYTNRISKGLEGNITTEMGLLSGDLADMIRKESDLILEFENEDYQTLCDRLERLSGHDAFKKSFFLFMSNYGIRTAGEIDIAKDRWIEDPEPLAKQILATVYSAEEGMHRNRYDTMIADARSAAKEMVVEVRTKYGRVYAAMVKRLIKVLRDSLPAREHHKYILMNLYMVFKRVLLEEASLLVSKGQLEHEKDIFYLHVNELCRASEKGDCLKELVKQRKLEYQHYQRLHVPRVMTSEGEEIQGVVQRENLPKGAMVGIPVSSGVIEGVAKVIIDPSKETLKKGEILVAPFTDPGWTPLFINAAGLVMEVGGQLTHGTVVAREYGIPAVVGIADVARTIKSGQKIRVDGNAGYIMVIEEKEEV